MVLQMFCCFFNFRKPDMEAKRTRERRRSKVGTERWKTTQQEKRDRRRNKMGKQIEKKRQRQRLSELRKAREMERTTER